MAKQIRISITLCNSNLADAEILEHISRFRTGKGMQDRAFEIRRLLHASVLNEKCQRKSDLFSHERTTIGTVDLGKDIQFKNNSVHKNESSEIESKSLRVQPAKEQTNSPGNSNELSPAEIEKQRGKNILESYEMLMSQAHLPLS